MKPKEPRESVTVEEAFAITINLFKDLQEKYDAALVRNERLVAALNNIACAAKDHDTGEREYKASDYEFILKWAEQALKD